MIHDDPLPNHNNACHYQQWNVSQKTFLYKIDGHFQQKFYQICNQS